MSKSTRKLPQPAEKTIEAVFDEFIEEQQKCLKPATVRKYEDIINLFESSLDGYAHQGLNKQENALFNRLYNATGDEHREFCQIFGPENIPGNVSEFLNYFMIHKVMCSKELKQAAGSVIKKLCKWLQEKGYIGKDESADMAGISATAARELSATEDLACMLADYADRASPDCNEALEDYFTIDAVEPGKLYLSDFSGGDKIVVRVPRYISDACRASWKISGAIGKAGKSWYILEVWNVYP